MRRPSVPLADPVHAWYGQQMILTGFVLGVLIANATVASGADWRTVAPVNGLDLEPGDRVLFEGGAVR